MVNWMFGKQESKFSFVATDFWNRFKCRPDNDKFNFFGFKSFEKAVVTGRITTFEFCYERKSRIIFSATDKYLATKGTWFERWPCVVHTNSYSNTEDVKNVWDHTWEIAVLSWQFLIHVTKPSEYFFQGKRRKELVSVVICVLLYTLVALPPFCHLVNVLSTSKQQAKPSRSATHGTVCVEQFSCTERKRNT